MTSVAEDNVKKPTMFDLLTILETTKIPWNELTEEQQKAYNPYMINRFVSSKEIYVPAIAQIDTMKLTPEQHYTLLCELISNAHKNYFDYKSYKKKDKKDKYSEDLVIYACCKEYEIGNREAKMYISMMPQSDIEKLATKWEDCYKHEKKL